MKNELWTVVELHLEFGEYNELRPCRIEFTGWGIALWDEPYALDCNACDYI